jgi:hypothetical protein
MHFASQPFHEKQSARTTTSIVAASNSSSVVGINNINICSASTPQQLLVNNNLMSTIKNKNNSHRNPQSIQKHKRLVGILKKPHKIKQAKKKKNVKRVTFVNPSMNSPRSSLSPSFSTISPENSPVFTCTSPHAKLSIGNSQSFLQQKKLSIPQLSIPTLMIPNIPHPGLQNPMESQQKNNWSTSTEICLKNQIVHGFVIPTLLITNTPYGARYAT